MRHLQLLFIMLLCATFAQAQYENLDLDGLKAAQAEKMAMHDAAQAEIDALQGLIDKFPGWKFGGYGSLGYDGIRNNNWFGISNPNSSQGALNLGFGGTARLDQEKFFWDNLLGVKLARTGAFEVAGEEGTKSVILTNNFLELNSTAGYKIAPKWAISAGLNWISTVLERETDIKYNFALNEPGKATISAGITWLPITNLRVDIHPLGFQKNWPGTLSSMAGAKIGATYTAQILPSIGWSSRLDAFVPYSGAGDVSFDYTDAAGAAQKLVKNYGTGDLTNWQWINTFTTNIWKGIGVVAELGLAGNRQQADLNRVGASADGVVADDNPMQSYYSLGLGYTF